MKFATLTVILATITLSATPAMADVPKIVTDIPPTHSLVAMVMGDLGEPELLMRSGSSPHDYSLRPSEASLLANADIVFWTSSSLTPWLQRALGSLAGNTTAIELLASQGTYTIPVRENALFQPHDHGDHDDHDDQSSSSTDEPDHKSMIDPHAWLDPENARHWLSHIADKLSELDPENASSYHANAENSRREVAAAIQRFSEVLAEVQDKPFVVFHDSYHYFETRFDIHAKAAISLSDGEQPGIRQIQQLREALQHYASSCVFTEPQFSPRLVNTVTQGLDVKLGELDPLGSTLEPGRQLYLQLLEKLVHALSHCLSTVE